MNKLNEASFERMLIKFNLQNHQEKIVFHEIEVDTYGSLCGSAASQTSAFHVTYAQMSLPMSTETYAMSDEEFFNNIFVCFGFKKFDQRDIIRVFFKLNSLNKHVFMRDYSYEEGDLKETQFLYSDKN